LLSPPTQTRQVSLDDPRPPLPRPNRTQMSLRWVAGVSMVNVSCVNVGVGCRLLVLVLVVGVGGVVLSCCLAFIICLIYLSDFSVCLTDLRSCICLSAVSCLGCGEFVLFCANVLLRLCCFVLSCVVLSCLVILSCLVVSLLSYLLVL
jgi:hypothetical protein